MAQDAKKEAEAEAQYLGANALFNRGDYARAIAEYEGFLKQFPDHPKAAKCGMGWACVIFKPANTRKPPCCWASWQSNPKRRTPRG